MALARARICRDSRTPLRCRHGGVRDRYDDAAGASCSGWRRRSRRPRRCRRRPARRHTIGTDSRGRHFREGLVAGHSPWVVLAIGAGLVLQSFRTMAPSSPGFAAGRRGDHGVVTLGQGFADRAGARAFHATLVARLRAVPGVAGAGAISCCRYRAEAAPAVTRTTKRRHATGNGHRRWTAHHPRLFPGDRRHVRGRPGFQRRRRAHRQAGDRDRRHPGRARVWQSAAAIGCTLLLERERNAGKPLSSDRRGPAHSLPRLAAADAAADLHLAGLFTQFSVAVRAAGEAQPHSRSLSRRRSKASVRGRRCRTFACSQTIVEEALGPMLLAAALMTSFGVVALLLAAVGVYGAFSPTT